MRINGTVIKRVSCTKFIGVMLDEKLLWDRHVQFIKPKIAKGIGILNKARKVLNVKVLVTLYNSIIFPYLITVLMSGAQPPTLIFPLCKDCRKGLSEYLLHLLLEHHQIRSSKDLVYSGHHNFFQNQLLL